MSMSTHVHGIRDYTDAGRKMREVYNACMAAGLRPPDEVAEFFAYGKPHAEGEIVEDLGESKSEVSPREMASGIEIDLSKLPKGVTRIVFLNSW